MTFSKKDYNIITAFFNNKSATSIYLLSIFSKNPSNNSLDNSVLNNSNNNNSNFKNID